MTGWKVAAGSLAAVQVLLRGVAGIGAGSHSIAPVDMRLTGQPPCRGPRGRDGLGHRRVPGEVALLLQVRDRYAQLLQLGCSHGTGRPVAFPVRTGVLDRVAVEKDGERGDAVDSSLQGCNLGQPFSTQVMVQSDAQGVKGLVVVQDTLALTDIGSHSSSFGANGSIALLGVSFLSVVARLKGCLHISLSLSLLR